MTSAFCEVTQRLVANLLFVLRFAVGCDWFFCRTHPRTLMRRDGFPRTRLGDFPIRIL